MIKKYRYKTWYWGKYITKVGTRWLDEKGNSFPVNQINLKEMQEYNESLHGWENSEEYKNEKRI